MEKSQNINLIFIKMEGQLREPLTFPAQRYAESFFRKLPEDSRFLQCTYQKFFPSSSID